MCVKNDFSRMATVIKLYNADNVNMEPAYTIKGDQVIGTGFVEYSIKDNTVYKGPFAGGMAVATFDDEHVYEKALPTYTISGDKIYKGPFAGGIVAFTIVREEE